jgi:hypothetical protein
MSDEFVEPATFTKREREFFRRLGKLRSSSDYYRRTRFWYGVALVYAIVAAMLSIVTLRSNLPPITSWYLGLVLGFCGKVVVSGLWSQWQWPLLVAVIDWKRVESLGAGYENNSNPTT